MVVCCACWVLHFGFEVLVCFGCCFELVWVSRLFAVLIVLIYVCDLCVLVFWFSFGFVC